MLDIGLATNVEVGLMVLVLVILAYAFISGSSVKLELHAYQKDFLDSLSAFKGLKGVQTGVATWRLGADHSVRFALVTDAGAALSMIIDRAIAEPGVKAAIFDEIQCVHCGSVSPAEWIKARKGSKTPYPLKLNSSAKTFLDGTLITPVEKVGEPPKKVFADKPPKRDASKAARCCVDWAIKNWGAIPDGNPKPE